MKKIKTELLSVLAIAVCFGFILSMYSWDGIVYFIENKQGRIPAEATDLGSLKDLKSKHINTNYTNNILENTITIDTSENKIYKFKQFYTNNNENICNRYSNLKVKFMALNVSVSGETPHITIDAKCEIDSKGFLTGVKFPKKMLSEISLTEKEIKINEQTIKLVDIYDQLPAQFKMSEVLFYNDRDKASSGSLNIPLVNKKNNFTIDL